MAPQSKDSHNPNQILRTYYEGTLFATVVLSIKSNVSIFVDREWQYQAGKKIIFGLYFIISINTYFHFVEKFYFPKNCPASKRLKKV